MNKKFSTTKEKITKSNTMKLLELKFNKPILELLKEDYMGNKLSILEMGAKYEISPCTVHRWLIRYEIPRRHLKFI